LNFYDKDLEVRFTKVFNEVKIHRVTADHKIVKSQYQHNNFTDMFLGYCEEMKNVVATLVMKIENP